MDAHTLRGLLEDVAAGRVDPDAAVSQLRRLPFADLGHARVDHHRALRQGLAEAVYGPGKTPEQCASIVAELLSVGDRPVLLTRVDDAQSAEPVLGFAERGDGAQDHQQQRREREDPEKAARFAGEQPGLGAQDGGVHEGVSVRSR